MIDDQLPVNRKTKQLTAPALAGDLNGIAALGMWSLAGASSQAELSDGLVTIHDLIALVYDVNLARQLAGLLVAAGLWHTAGHDCPRCEPVIDPLAWRFHDWWAMKYQRGEVVRETRAKAKEQQNVELVAAVWARDCIDPAKPGIAECRYCGKVVKRKDTRSDYDDRPQLDHVNPFIAAGPTNLVVACGACNRKKARRTPQDADMELRPEPRPLAADAPTMADSPALVPAAETTVSPGPAAAGSAPMHSAGRMVDFPPAPTTPATTSGRPPGHHVVDQPSESLLAGAREGAGARSPGSGSGVGVGSGTGSGQGDPRSTATRQTKPRRRNRKRGRGNRTQPQTKPPAPAPADRPDPMNAGPAPRVPVVGTIGSPWHGYSGPRDPLGDENHCPMHHLPQPCRRCAND